MRRDVMFSKRNLSKCHLLKNRARWNRVGLFELLEPRLLLTASSIDGRPFVDLGPSDNVALDQPRVAVELITNTELLASRRIIDDGDSGFELVGDWTALGGGYQGTSWQSVGGAGERIARWQFTDLTPNSWYEVAVTWPAASELATNAPFTIKNGHGTVLGQVPVNQRAYPNDFYAQDAIWKVLGNFFFSTHTATVELSGSVSSPVVADAARLVQRVGTEQSIGPNIFNTWLLDTGANSTLTFQAAVMDMGAGYVTEGVFEEIGVGGFQTFDVSAPYRFDFAGYDGLRNIMRETRILSDATRDLSLFGPHGIKGMSAMAERYTTLDFTGWIDFDLASLFMRTSFPETLPDPLGPRYTLSVDNRVNFSPDDYIVSGDHPPIWADLPFFEAQLLNNDNLSSGNFLYDTGAQVSIISSQMAFELGLDSNQDGVLDENDAQFARMETVGGVGGMITVPVFLIDEVHIPTDEGPDLVLTDLQWLVLDIIDEIDGVFGFDNVTSGWIEGFFEDGKSGYILQTHFDFRGWNATGEGKIYFDINPEFHAVVDPLGPGAQVHQPGGNTLVSEAGHTDTYDIWLTQPPAADVFVSLVFPPEKVTAGLSSNPSQNVLHFTPENWNVPQTVLVGAINDNIEQSFHRSYIRHISSSADPAYDGVGMPRIIVNIVDSDFPAVMVIRSDGETLVSEDGMTDTYELVLTYPPQQDVTIFLEHLAGQVTAVNAVTGTDFLVFTPFNWNIPQAVLVSAIDDDLVEGLHRAWITHRISTSDPGYQQAFAVQETVFIIDNDELPPPPRVLDVVVASSNWDATMLNSVGSSGPGNGLGYSLVGSHQLDPLAWAGIDQIHVVFSDDVGESFNLAHVALVGSNVSDYLSLGTLSYGVAGENVGTISLSQPIQLDSVVLAISETLQSAAGGALDGNWIDGSSSESGDGTPGGQFNFRFNSLVGDIDGNGLVNFADISTARPWVGMVVSNSTEARFDVDGNGTVSFADLGLIRQMVGSELPAPPELPSFGSGGDELANGSGDEGGFGGNFNFIQSSSRAELALQRAGLLGRNASSLPAFQWSEPLLDPSIRTPLISPAASLKDFLRDMMPAVDNPTGSMIRPALVDSAIESFEETSVPKELLTTWVRWHNPITQSAEELNRYLEEPASKIQSPISLDRNELKKGLSEEGLVITEPSTEVPRPRLMR